MTIPQLTGSFGAPRVSVVVPHYNDLPSLDLCLSSLAAQTLPREQFEIVVSDNGSPCGILAVADVVGRRGRLVMAQERGAGPARNAGIRAARGEIIAFTDSDCRPGRDWLTEGLDALDAWDFAGGAIRVETAGLLPTPAEAFELVFAFRNEIYVRRKGFSVTANLFVPRRLFDYVGLFSNHLSEDLDWCERARSHGYSLGYAADAVVAHPARRTWPEIRAKWSRLTAESFGLAQRRTFGASLWLARSYLVLASALPDLVRTALAPRLPGWRARFGAAAILIRVRAFRFVEAHRLFARHALARIRPEPFGSSPSA